MAKINLGKVKGDPFTFEDFTPEQLVQLKGAPGKPGKRGAKGDTGSTMPVSDAVDKADSGVAASSKAVKTAYDKALEASGGVKAAQNATKAVESKVTQHAKTLDALGTRIDAGMVLPGLCFPFRGTFGGPKKKHPVNRITGQPDLSYALCDGGTYTAPDGVKVATPNLQERMVMGAGAAYPADKKGGSKTHAHGATINAATVSGGVGPSTLNSNQMPAHSHALPYSVRDGNMGGGTYGAEAYAWQKGGDTHGAGGNAAHGHSFTGGDHAHSASVTTENNLPPYFALAYIMKL